VYRELSICELRIRILLFYTESIFYNITFTVTLKQFHNNKKIIILKKYVSLSKKYLNLLLKITDVYLLLILISTSYNIVSEVNNAIKMFL